MRLDQADACLADPEFRSLTRQMTGCVIRMREIAMAKGINVSMRSMVGVILSAMGDGDAALFAQAKAEPVVSLELARVLRPGAKP